MTVTERAGATVRARDHSSDASRAVAARHMMAVTHRGTSTASSPAGRGR